MNGGKAKNQIIIDALEMYYDALENSGDTDAYKEIRVKYLEERLVQFKQEMLLYILRILVGVNMAGKTIAIPVMSRIMDWSSN